MEHTKQAITLGGNFMLGQSALTTDPLFFVIAAMWAVVGLSLVAWGVLLMKKKDQHKLSL